VYPGPWRERHELEPQGPSVAGGIAWTIIASLFAWTVHSFANDVFPCPDSSSPTANFDRTVYWLGALTIGIVTLWKIYRAFRLHEHRAAVVYGLAALILIIGVIIGLPLRHRDIATSSECGG